MIAAAALNACGGLALHAPSTVEEKLSVALWAGIVVLAALCIAGLLYAIRYFAGRGAGSSAPCPGCGRFIRSEEEAGCPFCAYQGAAGARGQNPDKAQENRNAGTRTT